MTKWLIRVTLLFTLTASLLFAASDQYIQEIEKWRSEREARLKSKDGWLSLVGLFWLKPGENKFGSDSKNAVVLASAKLPAYAGSIWVNGTTARMEAPAASQVQVAGKTVTSAELKSDETGDPTILQLGSLSFHVIKRGDKLGLRVKDSDSAVLKQFTGIDHFPADPKWRVTARFEPYSPPKKVPIMNIVGILSDENSPGALVFAVNGKTYRLDPIVEAGSKELFVLFADKTSGKETYGAGRYLYAEMPDKDGKVLLDFNKAYNPPCAFTAYATCPLPPQQNRLPVRIEAGEKNYHHKISKGTK